MKTVTDIMRAAATEIGSAGHHEPGDGSLEGLISDLNWCGILEAELENHHYAFSREWLELKQVVDPKFGFDVAFRLPNDAIIARDIYWDRDPCSKRNTLIPFDYSEWEESDCVIHIDACRYRARYGCDPTSVHLEYTQSDMPVSRMSANFKLGMKFRMAAVYARSLAMESADAQRYEEQAEYYFQRARLRSGRRHNGSRLHKAKGKLRMAHMGAYRRG